MPGDSTPRHALLRGPPDSQGRTARRAWQHPRRRMPPAARALARRENLIRPHSLGPQHESDDSRPRARAVRGTCSLPCSWHHDQLAGCAESFCLHYGDIHARRDPRPTLILEVPLRAIGTTGVDVVDENPNESACGIIDSNRHSGRRLVRYREGERGNAVTSHGVEQGCTTPWDVTAL